MAAARMSRAIAESVANGDERDLPSYIAMYSKGLPHNALGEVDPDAYDLLLRALRTGEARDFDRVPCAGPMKLTNPQAGFSFNLIGPDPAAMACPPAAAFSSAQQAAEMIEMYWLAATRDVPFAEYAASQTVQNAAVELRATPQTVFRGRDAGSLAGPYISQFFWREFLLPPLAVAARFRSSAAGHDYLGDYESWRLAQNGVVKAAPVMDGERRYVRSGRDLAAYVHRDFSYQAPLSAALILLKIGVPASAGMPYARSQGQMGFTTFGGPHLLSLIGTVSHAALTACWFQKWMVHRRLRPEELGGRVENHLAKRASYPLHPSLLDSDALATTLRNRSSALLTSSYPEGSPTHPAYPAGHAVLAAAGTTVLKAFFDENWVFPDPVQSKADGRAVYRYDGPPLTLRGELDKLAANLGMGRCFAGIHWRSDVEEGLRLGEDVAIRVLREIRLASHESCAFRFHRLDGREVEV
jgi:hypothetical protein